MTEHHEGDVTIEEAKSVTVSTRGGQSLGIPGSIILGSALIASAIYFGFASLSLGGDFSFNQGTTPTAGVSGDGEQVPTSPIDVAAGELPILGSENAPVLFVEWSDYQCPFCKRLYDDVERQIIEEYVNSGQVAFAYRDFPFLGQPSIDAANAARCANEQGQFWEYHDLLFDKHPGSGHGDHLGISSLKQYAVDLGLNATQFNDCLDSEKYADAVNADQAAGRSAGVTGTPTSFINGEVVNGAQPFSAFDLVIKAAISEAK